MSEVQDPEKVPCVRRRVVVHGRVQGVWFRASTQREALRAGLAGWVRNCEDGCVEAVFEGAAQAVAALVDYVLKAEAVAHFGKGEALVRFFGLLYAGTGLAAVVFQTALGGLALRRLGLAGSVASHPALVGAATLVGFVAPFPWRGVLPRAVDLGIRNSVFRAGYELLYTPLAEGPKRSGPK